MYNFSTSEEVLIENDSIIFLYCIDAGGTVNSYHFDSLLGIRHKKTPGLIRVSGRAVLNIIFGITLKGSFACTAAKIVYLTLVDRLILSFLRIHLHSTYYINSKLI
jgi:hypothetical protein